ncbi:disulfide bond formation protein DsbA [Streptomyces sp. B6B3]|uniref:mycothiol-dependent nitroreductase Rv2466c family protein n=1 Tax=Streptomyces sp. B6B3 TaxID=3153570 RepID=UPI00325C47CC
MTDGRRIADFWFDPSCPYTWVSSRWLVEVTRVRPVVVRWHVMSLAVLNEGLDIDPEDPEGEYAEWGDYLWRPVRVCAAVAREHGQAALGRLFTELGVRMHQRGEWDAIPGALAEAGLPAGLAEAADSTAYDAAVRASHREGIGLVGTDVGTPVLAVSRPGRGRAAIFGPVVAPAPRGEAAGRLWDGALLLVQEPAFYELRRGRPAEPPS